MVVLVIAPQPRALVKAVAVAAALLMAGRLRQTLAQLAQAEQVAPMDFNLVARGVILFTADYLRAAAQVAELTTGNRQLDHQAPAVLVRVLVVEPLTQAAMGQMVIFMAMQEQVAPLV